MLLRILIVEDEILIAETIKLYLQEQGHTVQNICISYDEAVTAYQKEQPDLVLLDIRLYGKKSGIDFAKFLLEQEEKTPFIYLTSHYESRVLDIALETQPMGYLAKPIQKQSLWTTVMNAYRLANAKQEAEKEMVLFDGQTNHKVKDKEIVFIKSDHVYANVHLLNGRKIITRKPLGQILDQIRSKFLFQCHRSYIINIEQISSWGKDTLTLMNGSKVPVSRSKKQMLLDYL